MLLFFFLSIDFRKEKKSILFVWTLWVRQHIIWFWNISNGYDTPYIRWIQWSVMCFWVTKSVSSIDEKRFGSNRILFKSSFDWFYLIFFLFSLSFHYATFFCISNLVPFDLVWLLWVFLFFSLCPLGEACHSYWRPSSVAKDKCLMRAYLIDWLEIYLDKGFSNHFQY